MGMTTGMGMGEFEQRKRRRAEDEEEEERTWERTPRRGNVPMVSVSPPENISHIGFVSSQMFCAPWVCISS